jgi:hypothetical protein
MVIELMCVYCASVAGLILRCQTTKGVVEKQSKHDAESLNVRR